MPVTVLGADHRVLACVRQVAVLHDDLRPLPLAHEDVARVVGDVTAVLQPSHVHVFGADLALQAGLALFFHTHVLQRAREVDGEA